MNIRVDSYVHNLICYVEREPNLWCTTSRFYENPQMQQVSWRIVTGKLQVLYRTEEITVDYVKSSWNNLLESYNEYRLYPTVSHYIFPLITNFRFLERNPKSGFSFDGLFSRKYGRFLLFFHIILNIGFFLLEIPLTQDILVIKPTTCFQFSDLYIPMFALSTVLFYHIEISFTVHNFRALKYVAVISPIVIVIYYLLSFLECHNNRLDTSGLTLTCILFIITQVETIIIHAFKLNLPPTTSEMSTVLTTQLSCALLMLVQLPNTPWKHFYLVTFGWAFSNFLILSLYYVICHCNAKTLYRFQKRDGPNGFSHYWRDLRKEPKTFSTGNFGGRSVKFTFDGTLDLEVFMSLQNPPLQNVGLASSSKNTQPCQISDALTGTSTSLEVKYNSLVTAFYLPNTILIISVILYSTAAYTIKRDLKKFADEMGVTSPKSIGMNAILPKKAAEEEPVPKTKPI